MTRHFSILSIILSLLVGSCALSSDKKHIPEGYSKLTVILDDSSNFYLDKIIAEDSKKEFILSRSYDTTTNQYVHVYDSLQNNEYVVTLSSLLNRVYKVSLTLVGDTTIFIRKSQIPNFDTLNNISGTLTNLELTDTLCIAYASQGCFHNYSNKTLIYKKANSLFIEFSTDTSHDYKMPQLVFIRKQLPLTFSDTLRKLELSCIEGYKKQQELKNIYDKNLSNAKDIMDSARVQMFWFGSTTSSVIYINKGNKVFTLTNDGINKIPYYYGFMNALNL